MTGIKDIRRSVSYEMEKFEPFFKESVKTEIPLLNFVTSYILRRKGKQIRPLLVFLTAKMIGTPNKSTFTAAVLVELLHTATLVHDDVVDDSYQRRGFFSVYAIWKTKISVLVGDYLLSRGLLLAIQDNEYKLLEIVSDAVREMSEGELLQIQKTRSLDISEGEYFKIIQKKTAALISACTSCGAKSVDADEKQINLAKQFGYHAGIAFQIKDDIFDYTRVNSIGKPYGNDIKEKKLTLPLIHVLENCSMSEKKKILRSVRNKRISNNEIKKINLFVKKNKGFEYAEIKMNEHKKKAVDIIALFPESESKTSLLALMDYITERKK